MPEIKSDAAPVVAPKKEEPDLDNQEPIVKPVIEVSVEKNQDKFSREYVETLRKECATNRVANTQLKNEMRKALIRSELKVAALSADIIDLDALKMFDTSKLSISSEGDVIGVVELVDAVKKSKPYLFVAKSEENPDAKKQEIKEGDKDKTSSGSSSPEKAAPKPKLAKDLTNEEYDKMKLNGFKELSK